MPRRSATPKASAEKTPEADSSKKTASPQAAAEFGGTSALFVKTQATPKAASPKQSANKCVMTGGVTKTNSSERNGTWKNSDFYDKYGVQFKDLVELPNFDDYRRNYRVFYDKSKKRVFSVWQTPNKKYPLIPNVGFITQDNALRKEYNDYIKQHF